ncbi:MAG: P-II family nitrogen regulator [Candidatus Binatia bacterium]
MKMIWAVVRSDKIDQIARQLNKAGVSGCTVYPVRGYGEHWHIYEPLIHGGHHKLEVIVEDEQAENVAKAIIKSGSTGREGDGMLSVFALQSVLSLKTKFGSKES